MRASVSETSLWTSWRAFPDSSSYIIARTAQVCGHLDYNKMRDVWQHLIDRHAALRSHFVLAAGVVTRQVCETEPISFATVPTLDLRDALQRPFSLESGPLVRIRVAYAADGRHTFGVAMHHSAADFLSLRILSMEMGALLRGEPLPPAPAPEDFAQWQSSWLETDTAQKAARYRQEMLKIPGYAPGLLRPAPVGTVETGIPLEIFSKLARLARAHGTTEVVALLALWAVVLASFKGEQRLVLGLPTAARPHARFRRLVGCVANVLPVLIDVDRTITFTELLQRVSDSLIAAQKFQYYPFGWQPGSAQVPFRSLLSYYGRGRLSSWAAGFAGYHLPLTSDLALESSVFPPAETNFETTLEVAIADTARIRLVFDRGTCDSYEATALLRALSNATSQAVTAPEQRLRNMTLEGGSSAAPTTPTSTDGTSATIHGLFDQQVRLKPDAIAIVTERDQVSYRMLSELANGVAWKLRRSGMRQQDLIGVCLERHAMTIATLLGILKAGMAYVPFDPGLNQRRLQALVQHAGVRAFIDRLPSPDRRRSAPPTVNTASSLAYVLFTSGSTGDSKAVCIEHRSAVNFIEWSRGVFAPLATRILAGTPLTFDLSIFEIFATLCSGRTVVLRERVLDPVHGVELINTVPSLLSEFLRFSSIPVSVKVLNLAGEALPAALVRRLPPALTIFNLYGPTETTTYSTYAKVDPRDDIPPIGEAVRGTRLDVRDADLNLVPDGFAGELCIAGAGLAQGYLHRPSATAQRFVPDPQARMGERIYRTGDRVKRRADGALVYLGRLDRQLKLNGVRIEPSEIEATLQRHSDVRAAAVRAINGQLIAYTVGSAGQRELRQWCVHELPTHHVPHIFLQLASLPTTPRGKVDYDALPLPENACVDATAITETEKLVASLFTEVLGCGPVGPNNSFFALGGTSLAAIRLLDKVREHLNVNPGLQAIYSMPTVRGFAEVIEDSPSLQDEVPVPSEQLSVGPASHGQRLLWLAHQTAPDSPAYNVPLALNMRGEMNLSALQNALHFLLRRHPALRTCFYSDGEVLLQSVSESDRCEIQQNIYSVENLSDAAKRPFDLARWCFRVHILKRELGFHTVVLTMHHIIADIMTLRVITEDLAEAYRSAVESSVSPPAVPQHPSMIDFACWEQLCGAKPYWWRDALQNLTPPQLPYDFRRTNARSFAGARVQLGLPDGALEDLAGQLSTTTLVVGIALFAAVLGSRDVLQIATPVSLRRRPEFERVAGYLTRVIFTRLNTTVADSFAELVRRAHGALGEALGHATEPIEEVLTAAPRLLVADVNASSSIGGFPGLEVWAESVPTDTAKVDLALYLQWSGGGYFEYATDCFSQSTIEALAEAARAQIKRPDLLLNLPPAQPLRVMEQPSVKLQAVHYRTGTEAKIAALFTEVLAVETIDPREDFFARGGQSLLAMTVMARLNTELGISLSVRTVFENPTVQALAAVVDTELQMLSALIDEVDAFSPENVKERLDALERGSSA